MRECEDRGGVYSARKNGSPRGIGGRGVRFPPACLLTQQSSRESVDMFLNILLSPTSAAIYTFYRGSYTLASASPTNVLCSRENILCAKRGQSNDALARDRDPFIKKVDRKPRERHCELAVWAVKREAAPEVLTSKVLRTRFQAVSV